MSSALPPEIARALGDAFGQMPVDAIAMQVLPQALRVVAGPIPLLVHTQQDEELADIAAKLAFSVAHAFVEERDRFRLGGDLRAKFAAKRSALLDEALGLVPRLGSGDPLALALDDWCNRVRAVNREEEECPF